MEREKLEIFENKANLAWERTFDAFYYPKTKMIYDALMGSSVEETLDLYPTSDEIKNFFPNPCGWVREWKTVLLTSAQCLMPRLPDMR